MSEYKDKLRSLGFSRHKGTTRRREVIRETDGQHSGYHVDHWDGRVDAVVQAPCVTISTKTTEE